MVFVIVLVLLVGGLSFGLLVFPTQARSFWLRHLRHYVVGNLVCTRMYVDEHGKVVPTTVRRIRRRIP